MTNQISWNIWDAGFWLYPGIIIISVHLAHIISRHPSSHQQTMLETKFNCLHSWSSIANKQIKMYLSQSDYFCKLLMVQIPKNTNRNKWKKWILENEGINCPCKLFEDGTGAIKLVCWVYSNNLPLSQSCILNLFMLPHFCYSHVDWMVDCRCE